MSIVISAATIAGFIPHIPAKAEESGLQPYPYTLFASSSEDGAITVNAGNFCVNGNVATNGTIVSSGNININGTRTEQATESMIYILDKIDTRYFSGSNIDEHEDDYSLEELNININNPTEVYGEATLTGNININSALKALEDVNLYGEVKNTNDSVIFSKYGDIVIDSQNVNLNGLVYAPFGNVTVNAQNLNLNNVVIIAQSIVLTCPNVNANNSSSMSSFVGSESEPLDIPYDEWGYMKDENENGFPDFFEDTNNWSLLNDSDGDKLPDCVEVFIGSEPLNIDTDNDGIDDYYEVFVLFTDPTLEDSDENGISDYDEDFDEDSLINGQEYLLNTDPWNNDSDNDDICDGDEVNTYHTDPMNKDTDNDRLEDNDEFLFNTDPNNPDTNGNGILDGDEKFAQTFTYTVENEDCAVEEVIISMNGTGNIQKNTSVESIMNKDMICSDVVGLVGEPFEIETESQFDNATLSFKINRSKLGDTDFDNLMFLWYDEENYGFVELETFYDDINSIVSINTTHFSRYMVVDKNMWFEAWSEDLNQISDSHEKSACYFVLAVDCSGSMDWNDPTTTISPASPPYKPVKMCERHKAVSNFASSLDYDDKAAIVTFEDSANIVCEMTNNESDLYWASANFYNSGGTSFDAAISKSVEILNNNPSATRKKIILLTDGESSISNTILQEAIDAHIKIYTIGLGNSSDGILKRIANETGGEFFKAYTAQELVSIYTNNGFDNDFDTTDTDGDGLYDVVETAGIRIQNGQIIRGCDPTIKDTDNDGLADGQEIDPTIRFNSLNWCPIEMDKWNRKNYYFMMKSNPVSKDDTDKDGYSDIEDPEPSKKPSILGGEYSFLDGEIYYICGLNNNSFFESCDNKTSVISNKFTGNDNQKFKFEWCGNGYKIRSVATYNYILTLRQNTKYSFEVTFENDKDDIGQLWEVLPYADEEYGLVIRSKVLCFDNNNNQWKPIYLNCSGSNIIVSTSKNNNTRLSFEDTANWIHFGKAYMDRLGWIDCNCNASGAFDNYFKNIKYPLPSDVFDSVNGVNVILNQHNQIFKQLKLGDCQMYDVACEVMATYNAIQIETQYKYDFYKIAFEFDINAIWNLPRFFANCISLFYSDAKILGKKGGAGSNYIRIADCLEAYNVAYDRNIINISKYSNYDNIIQLFFYEGFLKECQPVTPVIIMSYFNKQIHTFNLVIKDDEKIYSVNEDCNADRCVETGTLMDYMDDDNIYLCVYLLWREL